MRKETNLEGVKSIAKQLVMVDLCLTEYSPVVVQHPFTSSGMVAAPSEDGIRLLDITKSDKDLREWQNFIKGQINHARNAYHIYMMTNKPYSLTFLKMAKPFLSKHDFSEILSDAWIRSENPNLDANFTPNKLLAMFKDADPQVLMDAEEREQLEELDDTVTVYRGVTSYNADNIKALSWTLEYDIKKHLGDKQINRVTTADIQRMYNTLKKKGRVNPDAEMGTTLADSTIRRTHMFLHEALDAAVRERLIARNPTNGTVIPKANYKDKQVFNDEQLDKFMEVIEKEPVWYDFFYTEITTGMRRGEICGLKWYDFDEKNGTMRVRRSVSAGKGGVLEIGETKTDKGKRTIVLPPSTVELLKLRKQSAMSDWIFPSLLNPEKPVAPNSAYQRLRAILRKEGLPMIRFHDLRHTFATHALKNGVDPKTLSGILGHTNASFTLDTYTHITEDMKRNASSVVGGFLTNILGEDLKPWQTDERKAQEA